MTIGSLIRFIVLQQEEIEDVGDEGVNNSALDGGGEAAHWKGNRMRVLFYSSIELEP